LANCSLLDPAHAGAWYPKVLQSFGLSPEDDVCVETTPPSHSKGRQLAQTSAEMIVNMVPVVGGTIAVALTVALNHRLNERRERWFTELAEAVDELQDRFEVFDPESLAENDAFVDAVVTATRIVDRTSQREKIEVLRNAVLNSALPAAPDQDIQQLYFTLIEDLTPTHRHRGGCAAGTVAALPREREGSLRPLRPGAGAGPIRSHLGGRTADGTLLSGQTAEMPAGSIHDGRHHLTEPY
jgi:hypothetical protein